MALVAILSVRVHGLMYRKCVASPISTTFMQSHVTTAPPPQCAAFRVWEWNYKYVSCMICKESRGLSCTAIVRLYRECTLQAEATAAAAAHVTSVLVEEVVGSVVNEVCGEVVKLVKREKQETLEGLEKQFLNRRLLKHWRR